MTYRDILYSKKDLAKPTPSSAIKTLDVCLDIGSTQTRSICFTPKTMSVDSEIVTVDTGVKMVRRSLSNLRTDKTLEGNLEVEVSTGNDVWHFVKGSMRNRMVSDATKIASSISKLDQVYTYQSAYFQIGLMVLLDAFQTGIQASCYDIKLTLALPPEDLLDSRQEMLKERLRGKAVIKFPRKNLSVNINITEIELYSEPVAVAFNYSLNCNDSVSQNLVFLECGGRSKGAIVTKQGTLVLEGTTTAMGGGENMLSAIADAVANRLHINLPDINAIRNCLDTGIFVYGNDTVDIVNEINEAKKMLASDCVDIISTALDRTNTKLEEVQKVVCTGRSFKSSIRNGKVVSPSLATFIADEFKYSQVPIVFETYAEDNPVVRGLSYYAMFKYQRD